MPSLRHVSRKTTLVTTGALALALAGSTAAWSATGKTVELSIDGQPRTVELRGDTVADVLAAAGVQAGEHDLLAPAADRPVEDGDAVALRRGRELQLVVDGVSRSVWVTADDVAEALDQIGLRADGAALSASRSRAIGLDGLALDVRLPKDVDRRRRRQEDRAHHHRPHRRGPAARGRGRRSRARTGSACRSPPA